MTKDRFASSNFPDLEEFGRHRKKYNVNVFALMLAWVKKQMAASDKVVQYEEVIMELGKFCPKIMCCKVCQNR
jgi:hypothetical protein